MGVLLIPNSILLIPAQTISIESEIDRLEIELCAAADANDGERAEQMMQEILPLLESYKRGVQPFCNNAQCAV